MGEALNSFPRDPTLRNRSSFKYRAHHLRPANSFCKHCGEQQPRDFMSRQTREPDQPFRAQVQEASKPPPSHGKRRISSRRRGSSACRRGQLVFAAVKRDGPVGTTPLVSPRIAHNIEGQPRNCAEIQIQLRATYYFRDETYLAPTKNVCDYDNSGGAGAGNRTRPLCLGSKGATTTLRPRCALHNLPLFCQRASSPLPTSLPTLERSWRFSQEFSQAFAHLCYADTNK